MTFAEKLAKSIDDRLTDLVHEAWEELKEFDPAEGEDCWRMAFEVFDAIHGARNVYRISIGRAEL